MRRMVAPRKHDAPVSYSARVAVMTLLPTVCVIGAGSSGIAAVKALHERGFEFDCFEASDRVGGLWVYKNSNGMSAAYRSLHINTSRARMEYADFPMPATYPDFPHHTQIAEYFDAYVDHFGFRDRITFDTRVTRAERLADGRWEVSTDRGDTRSYDALVLAMGNSAMDIAVEASFVARDVYLAARRGAWVIPKYILGRPMDSMQASARIPFAIRRRAQEALLRLVVGDMERYGLPKPDHRFLEAHPTVSDDVLSRLAHGEIAPKPNIAELTERTVRFADGSEVDADVVVYCTGYRVTFPFLDPALISAPDNDLPLFRRVFHPDVGGIYFIGLLQPIGAIMPLAELQSQWICDHLAGRYQLPPDVELRADIEAERAAMFKRYVASKRHTMEVDFEDYVLGIRQERRRGERRAALAGHRLPIAPAVPA